MLESNGFQYEESLMASILPSRMTHQYDGDLVLFLIGMRVNKPWRPDLWLPVFRAMPGMLAELARDPETGFLGSRLIFDPRGPWLVQYWNSVEKPTSTQATSRRRTVRHGPPSTPEPAT